MIAAVHSDRCINIGFLRPDGAHDSATSVQLHQDGDEVEPKAPFCMWMPFQKGQAAKTDQLAAAAAQLSAARTD
jgi:hypothetical protein